MNGPLFNELQKVTPINSMQSEWLTFNPGKQHHSQWNPTNHRIVRCPCGGSKQRFKSIRFWRMWSQLKTGIFQFTLGFTVVHVLGCSYLGNFGRTWPTVNGTHWLNYYTVVSVCHKTIPENDKNLEKTYHRYPNISSEPFYTGNEMLEVSASWTIHESRKHLLGSPCWKRHLHQIAALGVS